MEFPEFRKCHARSRGWGYTSRAASQTAFSIINDHTRTGMERNALIEESIARAFQLAYFIHGDRETALNIAAEALAKLEVAAAAQDKRLYYTPTGRAARAERFRTKVSVGELHLLQRLVYVESEPYERQAEQSPNGESPDEEDMLIYFIKHLVRITVRRNSFYVTLGLSRLLHNYSTAEAMEMYNVLVQDPGRVRDDYYYRSRKGRLMKELKERFGDRLRVTRGARGEERFQTEDAPDRHAELSRECLQEFTPWSTECAIPAGLDPLAEEIHDLAFDGSDPDREHAIEVNRLHAALHPDCFARLTRSLNFASTAERLTTPYFYMAKDRNHDQDRKPPRRSRRAPRLDEAEMNAVKNALAERSSRRKTAAAGLLRIIVDGSERARLDLNRTSHTRLETLENDELIEVRSADGLLLATFLLNQDESQEAIRPERSSIVLESGQRISFSPVRSGDGETAGATIDLSYRETRLSRAAALYLRRIVFVAGDLWRRPRSAAWKPAPVFAALIIIALGLIFFWSGSERERQESTAENNQPQRTESPAPPSPSPSISPAPGGGKKRPAPAPRRRSAPPVVAQQKPQPNEPETQPEVGPEDLIRNVERLALDGATLIAVKKVYVDPFGDDPIGKQFRDQLTAALRANRRFSLTANRDEADAVLKGRITTARPEQVSATVRLVNAKGDVVWPVKGPVAGKQYQGPVAIITGQITRDLLADMDKAERK